jgi:hypothetical protein
MFFTSPPQAGGGKTPRFRILFRTIPNQTGESLAPHAPARDGCPISAQPETRPRASDPRAQEMTGFAA